MTTTIAAIQNIINTPGINAFERSSYSDPGAFAGRGSMLWDALPPPPPLTAAQRTAAMTALVGGTVATIADVLALIATAAVAPVRQDQIWRLIWNGNDATSG